MSRALGLAISIRPSAQGSWAFSAGDYATRGPGASDLTNAGVPNLPLTFAIWRDGAFWPSSLPLIHALPSKLPFRLKRRLEPPKHTGLARYRAIKLGRHVLFLPGAPGQHLRSPPRSERGYGS